MGRHERSGRSRSRSRSYSPPPPPPRRRYDDQRVRRYDDHRHRRSPPPSGLLVRNISLDSRPEDLRIHFERFGPVKDVYLPKNYYTGEPRGFGFVKCRNPEDAAETKHELNHCVIGGREIAIVFAEENRKTPREMRTTSQMSGRYGGGSGARWTPPRFSRRRCQCVHIKNQVKKHILALSHLSGVTTVIEVGMCIQGHHHLMMMVMVEHTSLDVQVPGKMAGGRCIQTREAVLLKNWNRHLHKTGSHMRRRLVVGGLQGLGLLHIISQWLLFNLLFQVNGVDRKMWPNFPVQEIKRCGLNFDTI